MLRIETLTKDTLQKHLPEIVNEAKDFEFQDWKEKNYLRDLPDKWKFSILAFFNSKLMGFSINSNKSGIFYIHFFYIYKGFRSSGIGKRLIAACEKISRENNIKTLQLMCHKDNFTAINFYFNNKFYIKSINNNNFYIMEKIL